MGKGKDTLIMLLLLSNIILVGFLYKAHKNKSLNTTITDESVANMQSPFSNQDSEGLPASNLQIQENNAVQMRIKKEANNLDNLLQKEAIDSSTHAKLKFSSIAQFTADFPGDFTYMLFEDVAEDVLLLEGRLNANDTYSATLATRLIVKPEEVVGMLKSNPDMLPGLIDNLSWINDKVQPTKLSGPLPAGMGDVHFWRADNSQGSKTAAFVYAVREDKKGSYFFMVHGPTDYIVNNEGKFEKFLSSVKLTK
jgi:hypothetical protein